MKFHEIDFNSSEFDEFIEFPWKIYQNKYKWIPPLKESIKTQYFNIQL